MRIWASSDEAPSTFFHSRKESGKPRPHQYPLKYLKIHALTMNEHGNVLRWDGPILRRTRAVVRQQRIRLDDLHQAQSAWVRYSALLALYLT